MTDTAQTVAERSKAYYERQTKERGLKKVCAYVPADKTAELRRFAAYLRGETRK